MAAKAVVLAAGWLHAALTGAFPELKKPRIEVPELTCAASNIAGDGDARTFSVECTATLKSGSISAKSPDLFIAMLNSGAMIDRKSEPGTTYAVMKGLECSAVGSEIACKASKK